MSNDIKAILVVGGIGILCLLTGGLLFLPKVQFGKIWKRFRDWLSNLFFNHLLLVVSIGLAILIVGYFIAKWTIIATIFGFR